MSKPRKAERTPRRRRPGNAPSDIFPAPSVSSGGVQAPAEAKSFSGFKWLLILGSWAGFSLVTLTFPNYSWMSPLVAKAVPFHQSLNASMVLFLGMVFSAALFREGKSEGDFSKGASFFWLSASLGMTGFLCLHEAGRPMGSFSIDTAFAISHVRHTVDLSNYHSILRMFYGICPLWEYPAIALSRLIPGAPSILIQRLTNVLLEVGGVFVLYFAGKELGGRRLGIFAAALAAVSKALLVKVVTGYGTSGMFLAMGLAIVCTLRLFEHQEVSDFVKWGLAVGFLAFSGPYFQPLLLFFVFFVFGMLLVQNKTRLPGLAAWSSLAFLLVFFLYCSNAFSSPNWVDRLLALMGPGPAKVLLVLFLLGTLYRAVKDSRKREGSPWPGWVIGAWCSALLASPFLTDPVFLTRIKQFSLASNSGFLSRAYLSASFQRMSDTFQYLFWAGGDRADMGLPADSYFSYPEVILIALGLAFFLGKPKVKVFFLVLAAGVGASVHFFASETHSARLMACPPAFLLLGAYGLNEIWAGSISFAAKRANSVLLSLLLLGFWFWAAEGVYDRVYRQWVDKPTGIMAVRDQAFRDVDKGYQVYLAPEYSDGDLSVLYEGHPVHLLHRNNLVTLGTDENPSDVVILLGFDRAENDTLKKAFPSAQWSLVHNSDPGSSASANRCQIAFSDLSGVRQKIFDVKKVPPPYWRRLFSSTQTGLNFAFLSWEDRTTNAFDKVSPEVYLDWLGVRYEGAIQVAKGGGYEFHCKADNRTRLLVDGKMVFDLRFYRNGLYWAPGENVEKTLELAAGSHRVEVTTCFQRSTLPPEITLQLKGGGGLGESLWKSFDF